MVTHNKFIIKKVDSDYTADLIDKLKSIESSVLSISDKVVFKIRISALDSLRIDKKLISQIYDRSAGKPVLLLIFDNTQDKHILFSVGKDKIYELNDYSLINEIKNNDLLEIIHSSKGDCIIEAPKGVHFVTPSNMHTTKFLRVADALHSYNALDRISFWLQPHMTKISGILVDSWSLASIVLRALSLTGKNHIPFDSFGKHITHDENDAINILKKLDSKISDDGDILLIISITSSGRFIEKVKTLISQANIERNVKIISLYKYLGSDENIDSLSTLDFDISYYDSKTCEYCNSGIKKYDIHPKFYYPRENTEIKELFKKTYLTETEIIRFLYFLKFKKNRRNNGACFIDKYGLTSKALCVHRDDPNDGVNPRHHALYIDIIALLECESFIDEIKNKFKKINKHGEPSVVIIPNHDAGKIIKEKISKIINSNIILSDDLTSLTTAEKEAIQKSTHLCIMDDVVITGGRFDRYIRSLRENLSDLTASIRRITWFPLIARPDNEKIITTLSKSKLCQHSWKDELVYLYKIIIPNWSSNDCPWCHELKILNRYHEVSFDSSSCAEERIRTLSYDKESGIRDSAIFTLPNVTRKTLANNSPLAKQGTTDIMLLFIISIGLQNFRNRDSFPLGRGILQSIVLDSRGMFERFSEPLIQAIFLKVTKINEWDKDILSAGLSFINEQTKKGDNEIILGELLIFLNRLGENIELPDSLLSKMSSYNDQTISSLLSRFKK